MDKWMVFIIEPTRLHWFTLYRCIWQTVLSILFNMAPMFLAAIIMVKIIFQRLTKSLQRTWHIMTYHHPAERLGWCEDKEMTTDMTCLNYQSMGYIYTYLVGDLEHVKIFPNSWDDDPIRLIFFRRVGIPPTSHDMYRSYSLIWTSQTSSSLRCDSFATSTRGGYRESYRGCNGASGTGDIGA